MIYVLQETKWKKKYVTKTNKITRNNQKKISSGTFWKKKNLLGLEWKNIYYWDQKHI